MNLDSVAAPAASAATQTVSTRPRSVARLLGRAWPGRWRLKTRIAAIVVLLIFSFTVLHGALRIGSLASRAGAEIDSAVPRLMALLPDSIPADAATAQALADMARMVDGMEGIRHVRLSLHAIDGRLLASAQAVPPDLPAFLQRWADREMPPRRKPVLKDGREVAHFEIAPVPADELAELWEDQVSSTWLMLALSMVAAALILATTFRQLEPLGRLRRAFVALRDGRAGGRLPEAGDPEFDELTRAFNEMANALERSKLHQRALMRRLVESEEATRRRIAHDLHDELTPYLVALQPLARTLELQCSGRPEDGGLAAAAGMLLAHQTRMLVTLRNILEGLHPPEVDALGLREALGRLARPAAAGGGCEIAVDFGGEWQGFGATLDPSIYRMTRECLTNAQRHAAPRRIRVAFDPQACTSDGRRAVRIEVTNDGLPAAAAPRAPGMGLTGMRERCAALAGEFSAGPQGRHWQVLIVLPTAAAADGEGA